MKGSSLKTLSYNTEFYKIVITCNWRTTMKSIKISIWDWDQVIRIKKVKIYAAWWTFDSVNFERKLTGEGIKNQVLD